MGKKIDKSEYDNIVRMYKNGVTQSELAQQYKVTQSTISTIIKQNDKNWSNGNSPIVPESEYDNISDMYVNGMTQQQISEIYRCSKSNIAAILKTYIVLFFVHLKEQDLLSLPQVRSL